MMRWYAAVISILVAGCAISPRPQISSVSHPDLGSICGCYFATLDHPLENVFFAPAGEGEAFMRLDGRDVTLRIIGEEPSWGEKPGDSSMVRYEAGERRVELHRIVTGSSDSGFEYIPMKARIVVRARGASVALDLTGGCGC